MWSFPYQILDNHRTKNCGIRCGYYTIMRHIKENVGKMEKMSKHHLQPIIIWKLLLVMMEQLNKLWETKHDIFFGAKILKRKLLVVMQSLEVDVVKDISTKTRPLKVMKGVRQGQRSSHISSYMIVLFLMETILSMFW